MKKIISMFVLFYFLALLQTSFFVHWFPNGMVPNLIAVIAVVLSIFEHPRSNAGLWAALSGGFFLDLFSEKPMGFWIALLLGISFALKIMFEYYVRPPIFKKI